MRVLGISAFYHDSAAALVEDGDIVAAAQEERFTRRKNDPRFPAQAIAYCLSEAGIDLSQVDQIVFYDKPFLKFERIVETFLEYAPRGFPLFLKAMPVWLKEKLFLRRLLETELRKLDARANISKRLLFSEHHVSHAASAFYPSPFEKSLVLTLDGVGEWATASVAIGDGLDLKIVKELHFPHSLGLLYSAFTSFLGFKVNSGEYKVMGLAPYGEPVFHDKILEHLIDLKTDGSIRLNLDYFDFQFAPRMTGRRFEKLFGVVTRDPEAKLEEVHLDLAASIQSVTETILLRMTRALADEFQIENLCLAGGVALNCVANEKIQRDGRFKSLWIQPAAGDAGGALGAALYVSHALLRQHRATIKPDRMKGAFLGPRYRIEDISRQLKEQDAIYEIVNDDARLFERLADDLASGKSVGWFSGRMEFGPRALGARSIIADPRSREMHSRLNQQIKFRESFRPFAPAVLEEDMSTWFTMDSASPYMTFTTSVHPSQLAHRASSAPVRGLDKLNEIRSSIPAVTHVDDSARAQSVHAETNPRFHELLRAFKKLTGCPVLVNTSFNVRGEPIVCTPTDAFRCFMRTDLDVLVIENAYMTKTSQTTVPHREKFADD